MIRNALFLSILAHLILIYSLNALNINADKLSINNTISSDLGHVLNVRLNVVKEIHAEHEVAKKVNVEKDRLNQDQPLRLQAHANNIKSVTKKKQLGTDLLPTLGAGIAHDTSVQNEAFSFDSYLKPTDVDMSIIPLYALRFNNDIETVSGPAGVPIYLRIFVDQHGVVKKVLSLEELPVQLSDYKKIVTNIEQTQFIPAKKNGVAVNSYIDVTLEPPN